MNKNDRNMKMNKDNTRNSLTQEFDSSVKNEKTKTKECLENLMNSSKRFTSNYRLMNEILKEFKNLNTNEIIQLLCESLHDSSMVNEKLTLLLNATRNDLIKLRNL
jgi:transposase